MAIPDGVMEFYEKVNGISLAHGKYQPLTGVLRGFTVQRGDLQLALHLKEMNGRFTILVELAHMESPEERLFVDMEMSEKGSFYAVRAGEDEFRGPSYEFPPFEKFSEEQAWIGDTILEADALE